MHYFAMITTVYVIGSYVMVKPSQCLVISTKLELKVTIVGCSTKSYKSQQT